MNLCPLVIFVVRCCNIIGSREQWSGGRAFFGTNWGTSSPSSPPPPPSASTATTACVARGSDFGWPPTELFAPAAASSGFSPQITKPPSNYWLQKNGFHPLMRPSWAPPTTIISCFNFIYLYVVPCHFLPLARIYFSPARSCSLFCFVAFAWSINFSLLGWFVTS